MHQHYFFSTSFCNYEVDYFCPRHRPFILTFSSQVHIPVLQLAKTNIPTPCSGCQKHFRDLLRFLKETENSFHPCCVLCSTSNYTLVQHFLAPLFSCIIFLSFLYFLLPAVKPYLKFFFFYFYSCFPWNVSPYKSSDSHSICCPNSSVSFCF